MKNARIVFRRPLTERVKRTIQTCLLVPLAATILLGCTDECRSFNETTRKINRKTDGVVSNTADLKKKPKQDIMSEAVIDLINETHALSSPGLPDNVNITIVPEYCFKRSHTSNVGAYTVTDTDTTSTDDIGIYVPGQITVDSVRKVNHEISHLQRKGNDQEVFAQLNEFEQWLIGSVLLSRQGLVEKIPKDPVWELGYMRSFVDAVWRAKNGLAEYSEIYSTIPGLGSTGRVFIFLQLVELDGNVQALRDYIVSQKGNTIYTAVDTKIEGFIANPTFGYYDRGRSAAVAEVALQMAMMAVKEVTRRFGPDVAFDTFVTDTYPRSSLVSTETEHLFCSKIDETDKKQTEKKFCCVDIDETDWGNFPTFRKWIVAIDKETKQLLSTTNIPLDAPCE